MRMRRRGQRVPSVVLALAASAAVLALASAAVEPYLAAAGNAATAAEVERRGPRSSGLTITATAASGATEALEVQRLIDDALPGTHSTALAVQADPVTLISGDADQRVRLVARSGAADAIEVVAGGEAGDGLFVPEILAEELGLSPGHTITIARGDDAVDVTLAGVYRQLDTATAPDELADLAELAEPTSGRDQRPLDLVFGEPEPVLSIADHLGASSVMTWEHGAPADLASLQEARATRSRMGRIAREAEDPATDLGTAIARVSRRAPETTVGLGAVVRDADRAVAALAGQARAVGVVGQGVALVVVAAAALFAARHRTIELRLATVRGQGPARQGARAALRALIPMLLGAALGWGAALLLILVVGPPGGLPSGTATTAGRDVAVALVPALLVVAGITAGVVATAVRVGRRRRGLSRLTKAPWELAVLGLAAVALLQVRTGGGLALEAGSPQLSPLILAFPFLVLLGAVGLGVRAARRGLPALRRVGRDRGHAGYLAVRRLAAASSQGLVLAAACALALGLVVYTAALSGSLAVAVDEKAVLQLGTEAIASGGVDAVAVDGAEVLRGRGRLAPTDELVDVLLVDPDRFAEVAYWDRGLADGRELTELLAPLGSAGERLPVLAAGLDGATSVVDVPGFRVPIDVTAELDAFPGQSTHRPLVVASWPAAQALLPAGDGSVRPAGRWNSEIWATGRDAAERLEAAGATGVRASAQVAEQPRLVAVTWALGALQALAVLATALALVGVLLFVAGRQRETQISYALARRMGLRPTTHRAALGTEVLALLVLALVVATLVGVLTAAVVAGGLDPLPDLRPAPRTAWPVRAVAALTATLVIAGVGGAALLQRGADRANVAEVLRRG